MDSRPPSDDTELLHLSGQLTQPLSLWLAWALTGGMLLAGLAGLRAGRAEAPLAWSLIVLPLVALLAWWRWGVPLRHVVATRTGLLVSRPGREWFIPYPLVESAKESRASRLRTITVTLRAPVGRLRRFAFIPPRRLVGIHDAHPTAAELERRLAPSRSA
ncbi:MAG: hypothetical protein IPO09_06620 [Anaeromyxobacter sp.]|nr:hypothetical protein [Anaeromyxobacter sp.]MBL0277342.1 hypothetical protein [Anaeromyxobacter sp.]